MPQYTTHMLAKQSLTLQTAYIARLLNDAQVTNFTAGNF